MKDYSEYSRATSRRRNCGVGGVIAVGAGALLLRMGAMHDSMPETLLGLGAVGGGLLGEVCAIVLDQDITNAETIMRGSPKPII